MLLIFSGQILVNNYSDTRLREWIISSIQWHDQQHFNKIDSKTVQEDLN